MHDSPRFGRRSSSQHSTPITTAPPTPKRLDELLNFISEKERNQSNVNNTTLPSSEPPSARRSTLPRLPSLNVLSRGRAPDSQSEKSSSRLSSYRSLNDLDSHRLPSEPVITNHSVSTPHSISTPTSSSVQAIKAKVNSLNDTIAQLQQTITQSNTLHQTELDKQSASHQTAIQSLKSKYETIVAEQLKLIDSLVAQKQAAAAANDARIQANHISDYKQLEAAWQQKINEVQNSYEAKLQEAVKQTSKQAAVQSKSIKAAAIKSMQPEIDKLLANHKAEIERLQTVHNEAMRRTKGDKETEWRQMMAEACDRVRRDCQNDADRREIEHQAAMRSMMDQHSRLLDEQRVRLNAEIDAERKRAHSMSLAEPARVAAALETAKKSHEAAIEALHSAHSHTLRQLEQHHVNELEHVKQSVSADRASLERQMKAHQDVELASREAALRAEAARDRDAQIELVVTRLGEESMKINKAERMKSENRVNALQQQHINELERARIKQYQLIERINVLEAALADANNNHSTNATWDTQMNKNAIDALQSKLTECQQQHEHEIQVIQRDNEREMNQIRSQHRRQCELIEASVNDKLTSQKLELDQVHSHELNAIKQRVVEVVAKKDDVIMRIQRELRDVQTQMLDMQHMLNEQKAAMLALG